MAPFFAKGCVPNAWLVSKYCLGKNVDWASRKKSITSEELTTKATIWLAIICSRVSPAGNVRNIPVLWAQMTACILDSIGINVGRFIIKEPKEYLEQDSPSLMFPSRITELCKIES
ncbi:hypothetical protein HAX54_032658 [Datura stramonium]|uniref:Putative plant transposon protein domain-containing protein n=1 Tax=Datura stramonium TaxID=4076 RepID=A0ABS8VC53_DATST|nr:hypothetical protein [Datura stramonium]